MSGRQQDNHANKNYYLFGSLGKQKPCKITEPKDSKDINLVLYGHTHRYKEETIDKTVYFNPGESAGSIDGKSALGIVNLNNLEIRRIFF